MSSGFVSGGTVDKPIERHDEWLKAQQEIEANRRRKEEESRLEGGKTLYEVLQGNKAAKQEAFEESIKLKNQFRNLDEDEIEFLDSVLESTRAKEEAVKKDTTEQLDLFRRRQGEADKAILEEGGATEEGTGEGQAGNPTTETSTWAVNARKRKRAKEKEGLKGLKLRKSSSTAERPSELESERRGSTSLEADKKTTSALGGETVSAKAAKDKAASETVVSPPNQSDKAPAPASTKQGNGASPTSTGTARLGLTGYSSDEDD